MCKGLQGRNTGIGSYGIEGAKNVQYNTYSKKSGYNVRNKPSISLRLWLLQRFFLTDRIS